MINIILISRSSFARFPLFTLDFFKFQRYYEKYKQRNPYEQKVSSSEIRCPASRQMVWGRYTRFGVNGFCQERGERCFRAGILCGDFPSIRAASPALQGEDIIRLQMAGIVSKEMEEKNDDLLFRIRVAPRIYRPLEDDRFFSFLPPRRKRQNPGSDAG